MVIRVGKNVWRIVMSNKDDRGPLDLEKQIEELKLRVKFVEQDNLYLAKEIDRLNEYVQEMELKEISKKL